MRKPIANTYDEQIKLIDPNKPVRVYRNLHTGLWSVKQGVVRFHTDNLFLFAASFIVNERGRQRVLEEQRKNVHAYVMGIVTKHPRYVSEQIVTHHVTYDPYKYDSFVSEYGPVEFAGRCHMYKTVHGKMYVCATHVVMRDSYVYNHPQITESVETHLL